MVLKIAGHTFGIDSCNEFTKRMCHDYLSEDVPEVSFTITPEDTAKFDGQCREAEKEFYAIHGKIAHWLMERDVLLFHGSCLDIDGNAILFTAPSGTGKSTHARLWRERFGERVTMINDDKPMLQHDHGSGKWTAWGSPWCGKEGIHTNTSSPLRCIVVIHQALENTIKRLSQKEAADLFLSQALIPSDDFGLRMKSIELIGQLSQVPVYSLGCTISQEAVDLSYNALRKNI